MYDATYVGPVEALMNSEMDAGIPVADLTDLEDHIVALWSGRKGGPRLRDLVAANRVAFHVEDMRGVARI